MVIDGDVSKLTDEQKEYLEKLYKDNERMISTINEMLEVNHAEDLEIEYHFENVGIEDLIEKVIKDFKGKAYKKEVVILLVY